MAHTMLKLCFNLQVSTQQLLYDTLHVSSKAIPVSEQIYKILIINLINDIKFYSDATFQVFFD